MEEGIHSKFMFHNGSHIYEIFDKDYHKHPHGFVILGPPGIGKTTFVHNQVGEKKNWIDADTLLENLGVDWHQHENNSDDFKLNYLRADYILEQSKLLGYRIIGSLFWEYSADAVVIIPLEEHREYVSQRSDLQIEKVYEMRNVFQEHAQKLNIPIFENILEAVDYLENQKN